MKMLSKQRLLLAAGVVAAVLCAMNDRTYAADSDVIARSGTLEVTAEDVRAFVASLDPREQAAVTNDSAMLSQAVRLYLANQILLKEALAKKWDKQPAVAEQLERLRQRAVADSYLGSVAVVPAGYPTDADLQSAYDANKTAFLMPRQFDIAQIFVAVAKGADQATQDKAKKKLDDITAKLKQKGADFGAIATTDSDDPESAKRHGEIAWLPEAQIATEIRGTVAGLTKGGISDPIRLDDGWHILELLDTKAAFTRPLADVRDQLVEKLRAQRAMAERRAYLEKLMQQNPPTINEIALSKVLTKAEPQKTAK
jgi:parvulin-like peptidyl-prolyl isomerase